MVSYKSLIRMDKEKVDLIKKVLMGASRAGLDVAVDVLLPGSGPIVMGALNPVLDKISQRLGVEDVTSSPELAKKAASEFESDVRLQQIFITKLTEGLDQNLEQQKKMNGEVVQILNDMALQDAKHYHDLNATLTEDGVVLSPDTFNKLRDMYIEVQENWIKKYEMAPKQNGVQNSPDPNLTRNQILEQLFNFNNTAVHLINDNKIGLAKRNLNEAWMLLTPAIKETPPDPTLTVMQGYLYKTRAGAFLVENRYVDAQKCLERALEAFNLILIDTAVDKKTVNDLAGAMNGVGNIYYMNKEYDKAVDYIKRAIELSPNYINAWHDLFLSYYYWAAQGELHFDEMREAYEKIKDLAGPAYPDFDDEYLARLGEKLQFWEVLGSN